MELPCNHPTMRYFQAQMCGTNDSVARRALSITQHRLPPQYPGIQTKPKSLYHCDLSLYHYVISHVLNFPNPEISIH